MALSIDSFSLTRTPVMDYITPSPSRHVWDCNFILITSQVKQFTLNNDAEVLNSGPFLARSKRSREYSNGRYRAGVLWVGFVFERSSLRRPTQPLRFRWSTVIRSPSRTPADIESFIVYPRASRTAPENQS